MKHPINAILIGAGQRGADVYGTYALAHPDEICFVAVAEPNSERQARFAAQHKIPSQNQFESWEPLLSRPQYGQVALVCTQDQQHTAPTLAALRAGYDVLLEKQGIPVRFDPVHLITDLWHPLFRHRSPPDPATRIRPRLSPDGQGL